MADEFNQLLSNLKEEIIKGGWLGITNVIIVVILISQGIKFLTDIFSKILEKGTFYSMIAGLLFFCIFILFYYSGIKLGRFRIKGVLFSFTDWSYKKALSKTVEK